MVVPRLGRESSSDVKMQTFQKTADLLKVMAHPTRLAILDALRNGPKCVTDVCDILDVLQPNISQHLSVLRQEGLVNFSVDGKKRCYYLENPDLLQSLLKIFAD